MGPGTTVINSTGRGGGRSSSAMTRDKICSHLGAVPNDCGAHISPTSREAACKPTLEGLRIIRLISQESGQYLLAVRTRDSLLPFLNSNKDGIDLGQYSGIIECKRPPSLAYVLAMEDSETLHRLPSA